MRLRMRAIRAVAAGLAVLAVGCLAGGGPADTAAFSVVGSARAQVDDRVPGNTLGNRSDAEFWRKIRGGHRGQVSIPAKNAGLLVQSRGESWRVFVNGPIKRYGSWLLGFVVVASLIFFVARGPVRLQGEFSGRLIRRFNSLERFAHWLTATSFVVLALTGLNVSYGRYVLRPIIGGEAFATVASLGKYAHNFVGFAFFTGVVLVFVLWIRDNLPDRYDLHWIARFGGLFDDRVHPPARRFNAGQKIQFWVAVVGGTIMFGTGLSLLFPLYWFDLPATQIIHVIHLVLGLLMIAGILGHIYIGTIGMQGAFTAMGTGLVDENWLREHHAVWYAETFGEPIPDRDLVAGEAAGEGDD